MKDIDESKIWREVQSKIKLGIIPYVIETPLSFIEQALWPNLSSDELKYWGQILSRILKAHNVTITKRNGRRYAIFPKHVLTKSKKKKVKAEKVSESERVLVEAVWRW